MAKLPTARSGDAAEYYQSTKWQYFRSLLFLKDIVKARTTTGPLNVLLSSDSVRPTSSHDMVEEASQNSFRDDSGDNNFIAIEKEIGSQKNNENTLDGQEIVSEPTVQEPKKKAKRKRDTLDEYQRSVLQLEERKLEYMMAKSKEKDNQEDENLLFFKSLLTHINRIPQHKILRFRRRLEDLVEEFAYPAPINPTNVPVTTNFHYQTYSDPSPYSSVYSSHSSTNDVQSYES